MNWKLLSLFGLLSAALVASEQTVCYFSSWAVYRPGNGKFDVENVDPFVCTHLIFAFAGVDGSTSTIQVLDTWNELCPPEGGKCAYDRFVALKQQNPALVVTLAVGGWNEGSADFSTMASTAANRKTFIDSAIALLNEHGFDGLDYDWEYPCQRGGVPEDKENFVALVKETKEAFSSNNPPLRVTAAVGAGKNSIDTSYDVPGISQYLDAIHLMTYDFHGAWETQTMHPTPLCGYPEDTGDNVYFRVDYAIDYWIQLGAPKEKLVVGVAAYGRGWTLADVNSHGIYATGWGGSSAGPYTREAGYYGYNEICLGIPQKGCEVVHDPNLHEPYTWCSDSTWVGYEEPESAYTKARYAKNHGLAGVMVWSIDTEDFIPSCSTTSFPLIRQINDGLAQAADADPFECPPITTIEKMKN